MVESLLRHRGSQVSLNASEHRETSLSTGNTKLARLAITSVAVPPAETNFLFPWPCCDERAGPRFSSGKRAAENRPVQY